MQGIDNYIPETTHVSGVYSVAAVLYLHSVLHVMLFRPEICLYFIIIIIIITYIIIIIILSLKCHFSSSNFVISVNIS